MGRSLSAAGRAPGATTGYFARLGGTTLALLTASALASAFVTPLQAQSRTDVVIAATTDVHGRLRGWDYYGNKADPAYSLAAAATIVDSLRRANPDGVVLVEGGDILQGNPLTYVAARVKPTPVHPVIAAMNVMRYDAAVLGNHEFNYGVPLLRRAISQAGFPFLAANVQDARGKNFVAPWTMVTRRGVRVAIVGGTTPGSMVWDRDNLKAAQLTVSDIVPAVRASVAAARKQKADVVVALVHSGLSGEASYDTVATGLPSENVAARLPREIEGIDVVVLGHSHREVVDSVINGARIVQPRNWAGSVGIATLSLEKQKGRWRVASSTGTSVRVTGHAERADVLAAAAASHQSTLAWVNSPVGRTTVAWSADSARVADVPITDFVNEVMRRNSGAQLAATAAFSLDAGLDTGAITLAELSRLYPYDNTLRAVKVSGAQLRAFLEHSARYYRSLGPNGEVPSGGIVDPSVPGFNFDVVSGAEYTLDLRKPLGQRVTRLEFGGKTVQPTDSFTLALNNYRQGGGGGYAMLAGAPLVHNRDLDIRQLLIEEVQKVGTLDPSKYATTNWSLEPASARSAAFAEQRRNRVAEQGGRAVGPTNGAPPAGQRTVRVIAMSDFHAALRPSFDQSNNPVGGAVALSAAIRKAQSECVAPACESVVIDAGDMFTGTPASDWAGGRPTVDVMNRLDVAAGALGNHEFDFGQDTLRQRIRDLRHAVLGANVRGPDGQRPAWLRADTIVQRGGVWIGIVGAAGTHTPETASRRKVGTLTFLDPLPIFVERTRALRAAGAQVVVAVIHDGGRCERDRPDVCSGTGIDLGRRLGALTADRPDLYVMGHAHVNVTLDFNGLTGVEPTSSGRGIVVVDLPVGGGTARAEVRPVRGTEVAGAQPQIDSIVNVSVARVQERLTQPVGTVAEAMRRTGSQYGLGNLLADAMRVMGSGDIGLWNNGGIRADVPAGPLNYGGVHYVTPFGNLLARTRVRGRDLAFVMETALNARGADAHVSGLIITFDTSKPAGQRVVRVTDSVGKAIEPDRIYTIVMNDFMVENDFREPLARAVSTEFTTIRDIDMFAEYLRKLPQPIRADATPRFRPLTNGGN
ncbi:MAG: 5'-nucleotidase C-terminal domain-containing protein [Gemmatimonadaceae bacterium]|nr:5'-nucleotidase C-terminal domain-containing protein [Gemmatimonadaceae bacterium]